LRRARVAEEEVTRRVGEVADLLQIAHVLSRLPLTYSGGERQRVAIGRAIAHRSDILLLDEPLSNLDARIRLDLRIEFRRLHQVLGQTVIYVTHDQGEALSLADRVAMLKEGRLEQIDKPEILHDAPVNRFVAEFVGSPPMNLIPVRVQVEAGRTVLVGNGFTVAAPDRVGLAQVEKELAIGVRPEAVRVALRQTKETPFAGRVRWLEHHGRRSIVHAEFGGTFIKAAVPSDFTVAVDRFAWFGFATPLNNILDVSTDSFLDARRPPA
jgi:multiple sugar transport system ATP-binding protein